MALGYSCLSNLDMLKSEHMRHFLLGGYSCLSNLDMLKWWAWV